MSRLRVALVLAGLVLGAAGIAAAQVRDQPRIAAATQVGIIAGRVEVEIDRQRVPVRRARVTLTPESGGKQSTTTTDTDGRYRVERLAAGSYRLRAEKLGFVLLPSDATRPSDPPAPVLIKVGETTTVDVLMQRAGAFEGQFLDDKSRAIARLTVYADRIVGPTERRSSADTRSATTDDLGRFRLHTLQPGRYYLRATPPPPASGNAVYYPGAPSSQQASVLTLVSGQTIDRLDFTVATAPLSPIAAEALAANANADAATRLLQDATRGAAPDVSEARVAGRVTRGDTGEPIVNATVQMRASRGGDGRMTRTNADGRFEFTRVSADSYVLTATAAGFVSLDGTLNRREGLGTALTVKEREQIETANLSLAPPGAIEGRVLDEFGDPAPGVSLQLTQWMSAAGRSVLLPDLVDTSTNPTDDRGWFRMYGLPPGDYYLLAPWESASGSIRAPTGGSALPAAVDDSSVGFAATFFPGTESLDAAMPVHVGAGTDTRDVTFSLVPARLIAISGVASDVDGRPVSDARVMLIQTYGGEIRTIVGSAATAGTNGSFRLAGVPEGTYVLQGIGAGLFGSLPITAAMTPTQAPVAVTLTMRPLVTARGHLSFDGDAAAPRDPSGVTVHFVPTDFTSGPIGGNANISRINSTWDFEIPNLAWKGVIRTLPIPGWWLKSVMLNGRDITDTPYDFQSADVNGLEVVLTSRVGSVTGTVIESGRPVANATIVVFGADDSTWTFPSRFLATARPDAQSAFSIRGLLPGRYLAVAVPSSSTPRLDREGLAMLRPFATPIAVSEGAGASLTLTMIRR